VAAEYAFFFGVVARAGALAFGLAALFVAGAFAVWAYDTWGAAIIALATNAKDTAIFVKQVCFAIENLIGL
jgi:hypothetical protein